IGKRATVTPSPSTARARGPKPLSLLRPPLRFAQGRGDGRSCFLKRKNDPTITMIANENHWITYDRCGPSFSSGGGRARSAVAAGRPVRTTTKGSRRYG